VNCRKFIVSAALFALVFSAAAQTHRYNVVEVPPLPGQNDVQAAAMNNHGAVVGISVGPPTSVRNPILFRPGIGTQSLPLPPGYDVSFPTDINDAGVIVGYCQTSFGDEHPRGWRYENGQFTFFAVNSYVHSINNNGVVVGRSCWTGGFPPAFACYFLDDPATPGVDATFGTTNTYPESQGRFADINDLGEIAFTAVTSTQAQFRAADGTLIGITPATAPYVRSFTWGINDAAQVIGRWEYSVGSQYYSRAFVWTAAGGAQQIGMPGNHVRPKGINGLGQVVGESGSNQTSFLDVWVWSPENGAEDLDLLIDPAAQLVLYNAEGINDNGEIVVRGARLVGGGNVTALLTPVQAEQPGDVDGDGDVDLADLSMLLSAFGSCSGDPGYNAGADFDASGCIELPDLSQLLANYGT
jgi:uncharacterized membrane protein